MMSDESKPKEALRIRILVEGVKNDEGIVSTYSATSFDEFGAVCMKRADSRAKAIEKCEKYTKNIMDIACEFTIEDMTSVEDTKKRKP